MTWTSRRLRGQKPRGSPSRSLTSPTIATSGAIRRNPATNRRRSTSLRSGRAGRVCMWATFGRGTSVSKTSSATTTRRLGSSRRPGRKAKWSCPNPEHPQRQRIIRSVHSLAKSEGHRIEHAASISSASEWWSTPENLRILTSTGRLAPHPMHDLQPGAIVELGVLQPLGGIQLPIDRLASSRILVSTLNTWSSSWKTSWWYPPAPECLFVKMALGPLTIISQTSGSSRSG